MRAVSPVGADFGTPIEGAYIGGQWLGLGGYPAAPVLNPADGSIVGQVPCLDERCVEAAVAAAAGALPAWSHRLPRERSDILMRWHDLILDHQEELARLMTLEQGKPLAEARGEIAYGAGFARWFAEETGRLYGETIPSHLSGARLSVVHEPLGVVAAITPWNFPSAMLIRKAAAALAAGCTVVAVPSMETPFSALALARLAEHAGLPAGAFSVLTGTPSVIVGALCADVRVRGLSFTGSTEIGRLLYGQCAGTLKRLTLELGGHAPFIVFPDADLEVVIPEAINAKFQTTGQDCLAANRIFVHRDIYQPFAAAFSEAVRSLQVGPGLMPDVEIGPLIHRRALSKVAEQVADARAKGAKVLTGGNPHALGGLFYEPTVLADVTSDMAIMQEETFGPVAAIAAFDSEAEVVAAANATEYGLVAYVFTNDLSRAWRLTDALEFGMVALNRSRLTGPPIPFGGIKQSGLGREGAHYGIEEFTTLKYVCMGVA